MDGLEGVGRAAEPARAGTREHREDDLQPATRPAHSIMSWIDTRLAPALGQAGGATAMAHRSRPTTNKRQREQARIAKRNDKAARLADRARRPSDRPDLPAGVDPDIAD